MIRLSSFLLLFLSFALPITPISVHEVKRVESIIAFESFEGSGDELGYTSDTWSNGFSNYADRVSNQNAGSTSPSIVYHISSGVPSNLHDDGTGDKYFFAVDDLDDGGNPRSDDLAIITFDNVDVSSATDLKVKLLLGTDRADRFEADDYFQVYYAFDANISAHPSVSTSFTKGNYTLLADFRGSAGATNASQDADFNEVGDGALVLPFGTFTIAGPSNDLVMSDLSFSIPDTGTNLSIRIVMATDSGDETFIMDNMRVVGDVPASAPSSVTVAATAFIEGAYNGTSLNTTLNANIPSAQPYSINGHSGGSAGSIPAGAVDWVLVELREAGSAAAALNNTRRGSSAGFLMSDGTIKATDGISNLSVSLSGNSGTDYFVVIYHRNHLPIMSANAVAGSSGTLTIDFTSSSATTFQTTTALVSLSGGKFGMPAGDTNDSGTIDATDLSTWSTSNGLVYNYSGNGVSDFNLDGVINAVDRNDFHQKNTSKTRQVPST